MNIGFTGTQQGMSPRQLTKLSIVLSNRQGTFHHGDCIGADEQAFHIAVRWGYEICCHPPNNPSKRAFLPAGTIAPELPYLIRNQHIVDTCDLLIAAPKSGEEILRSGTWATIRYARKKDKHLMILRP